MTVLCFIFIITSCRRLSDSFLFRVATVLDKNSWHTLTKCSFFPSRAPLVPFKVAYRGSVTKSCAPTFRGQGDPKLSQPFWLRLCFRGILGMWLLVGSSDVKLLGRYIHVSEPFFWEKHKRFHGQKERRQSIQERSLCFFNYNIPRY